MKLNPKFTTVHTEEGEQPEDAFFDVTLMVDHDNNLTVIDNTVHDYHDLIDCETLAVKQVKISI